MTDQEENELLDSFSMSFSGKIAMWHVGCAQWASMLVLMLLENVLFELDLLLNTNDLTSV